MKQTLIVRRKKGEEGGVKEQKSRKQRNEKNKTKDKIAIIENGKRKKRNKGRRKKTE